MRTCGSEADQMYVAPGRAPGLRAARIVGSCWLKMLRLELTAAAAAAAADARMLAGAMSDQ